MIWAHTVVRKVKRLICELAYMEFPFHSVHVLNHRNSATRFITFIAPIFLCPTP